MKLKPLLASKTKLPAEVQKLFPASYQAVGDICLLKLDRWLAKRYGHMIGGIIIDNYPEFRTICWSKQIIGEYRKPEVEVLAGDRNTETIHRENNCSFKLDVSKIMWSKGNHQERKRMISLVKKGEIVVDMFAGIGYWAIPIAKFCKPEIIYAIEKNPEAYRYLDENIRLNYVGGKIIPVFGDCRKKTKSLPKPDRIIMGYFPNTIKFLKSALKISKKGTAIHFHEVCREGKEKELFEKVQKEAKKTGKKLELKKTTIVKQFAPRRNHVVLDLGVC